MRRVIFVACAVLFVLGCKSNISDVQPRDEDIADNVMNFLDDKKSMSRGTGSETENFELVYNETFDYTDVEELLAVPRGDGGNWWYAMTWFGASKNGVVFKDGKLICQSFRGKPTDDRYNDLYKDNETFKDGGGFLNGAIIFHAGVPYGYYEADICFKKREYSGGWGCYYFYWHKTDEEGNIHTVYEYDIFEENKVEDFDITTHWQTANYPVRRSLSWHSGESSFFTTIGKKAIGEWHKVGFLWTPTRVAYFYDDKLVYVIYEDNRNNLLPLTYVSKTRDTEYPIVSNQAMDLIMGAASSNATAADAGNWVMAWTGYPTLPPFGTAPADYRYDHFMLDNFKYYKFVE